MKAKLLLTAVASAALLALTSVAQVAQAKTDVVWWDFLGGGDGVRMKALIKQFNDENPDIDIQATTLEWGPPFYTKVQTSAAVGEGPDVMTYHLSRMPLGVSTGTLRPFTDEDLKSVGLSKDDYFPSDWEGLHVDGKLYGVPLDIHSIVLYYNKTKLKAAGLLGDNGLPKGLDGKDNFDAALKKLTTDKDNPGISFSSDDGTTWRILYTFLAQQDGVFMKGDKVLEGDNAKKAENVVSMVANWEAQGWAPKLVDYPASIALFTSGKAAFHINGVWEVPTMTDLAKNGKLGFEWGAIQIPTLFAHPATWADSHSFAIPARKGNPISKEKLAAVMKVIAWMNKHSLFWATAGHIPAYKPVTESEDFKKMQPNATYSSLAKTAVFDPKSKIAGVASPVYAAVVNFIAPAFAGQLKPADAVSQVRDQLESELK
ncbi:MAG TPA: extracellular solute-binding protein [Magnetospirillaceae bacterium]|jgi:multiple sugar transport system substrate-binding protein